MAPPPEYDKEPKAPDKSVTTMTNDDSKILHTIVNDQQANSDHKPTNPSSNIDIDKNKVEKCVENLDDGRLRALLDEAITYKNPKDREGKSDLFKELLEKAEQQDDQSEAAARGLSGSRARHGGGGPRGGRHALPHSNSLQDIVAAALAAEPAPRRQRHHAPPAPVSTRAIQGGSLPSGVDTSFLLGEEPGRGAGYLATVRCVNPPPLAERRVSASDANCPAEVEVLHRRSKPVLPMTYTARATLEIGSGSVCSGRAVTTTTASNQGDSAIPFSCITTPEVVASCNTTSTTQSAVAVDPKPLQLGSCYRAVASLTGAAPPAPAPASAPAPDPAPSRAAPPPAPSPSPTRSPQHTPTVSALSASAQLQPRSVISSSFNGLSLSRAGYGAAASAPDEYKKSLDENGNAVQGFSSPISGSSQHKKPRRKKSSKNETVITSHQIDGYQGNKDLNEVLRFIESNADHGRGAKLGRAKHKDDSDDKGGKKRSTERRKDKETKPKRASSLEELSRTKLEDLTDAPEPPLRADKRKDRAQDPKERRSWGDDARDSFYYRADHDAPELAPPPVTEPATPATPALDAEPEPANAPALPAAPEPPIAAEPQPITEQMPAPDSATELTDFQTVTKRRKPRRRTDEHEREPPRRPRPPSPRPRRESAPPSDRSNDSNDDLDSVHSLPADAGRAPAAPAPPPPPHASYADIARTRHNIPDLIESCNFYSEGEAGTGRRPPEPAATGVPGDTDYPALGGAQPAPGARVPRHKPAPRRDRKERPPVATPTECPAPDVVADRRPPVILLDSTARPRDMDGVTFGFDVNEQLLGGALGVRRPRCDLVRDTCARAAVCVRAGLHYVPPDPPPDTSHLHQIVDYVGHAWEDVLRCGGKVRYFSE